MSEKPEYEDEFKALHDLTHHMTQLHVQHHERLAALEKRLTALESRQRRQEAMFGRAFWTNTEVGDMKCRVLVSGRTEETGHD